MAKGFEQRVGVFEARQWAVNALKREKINTRAQQLGTPENATKPVETFTPKQLKAKEEIVGLQHGQDWKNQQQTDWTMQALRAQHEHADASALANARLQLEPQMLAAVEQKIGQKAKQKILEAIRIRKAGAITITESSTASTIELASAEQQVKLEAERLIQQAPENILLGSVVALAIWVINRLPNTVFKIATIGAVLTLVLAACSNTSGTPTVELPNPNTPVPGETTGAPEASETAPATITIEAPTQITQIEFSSSVESIYTDTLIELGKAPETATDFANRIGTNGLALIDPRYNTFHINAYGFEYALNETGDTAIFDIVQQINGKDTYLYVTLEGGIACAQTLNPNFDPTGAHLDFTATNGVIARLVDASGRAVCGVDLSASNPGERQWKALNENGDLIGDTGEVIATPTSPTDPNINESPILVSDQEVIAAIADKIIAGQAIDTSSLTIEQRVSLTETYTEKLNQQRGANPVIYNNESYIDPLSLDFLDIHDGTSKQEQTIQMYLPAYPNTEGYLMVKTPDGWIQINNSKDVSYEVTSNPFDPNIKWPDTEKVQADWLAEPDKGLAGLTIPQALLGSKAYPASMAPVVILEKQMGEIKIEGFGMNGAFKGLIVEKDNQGNPIAARVVLITGPIVLYGDNLSAMSGGSLRENSGLWKNLEKNTLYYMIYMTDQKKGFSITYPQLSGSVTDGYHGLSILPNQSNDLVLICGNALLQINN